MVDSTMFVLSWVLSIAGALLALVSAFTLFKRDLDAPKLIAMIERLVNENDSDKARRICRVNYAAPAARIALYALTLELEARVLRENDEADYRSAPEEIPLEQRAREVLQPFVDKEIDSALRLAVLAGAGGALALGSLWPPWPLVPTVIGVVGVLLAALSLRMHASVRSGVVLMLERTLPLVRPAEATFPPQGRLSLPAVGEALALEIKGPDGSKRTVHFDDDVIKIGRIASAQLVLDDGAVSRLHAVIEVAEDGPTITDLGSTTGTYVNGRKANKSPLFLGDKIAIGQHTLTVR